LRGVEVEVGTRIKYLDLTLDSHWAFDIYFERLAPRALDWVDRASGCAGFSRGWYGRSSCMELRSERRT
jgi:hypothetical protein